MSVQLDQDTITKVTTAIKLAEVEAAERKKQLAAEREIEREKQAKVIFRGSYVKFDQEFSDVLRALHPYLDTRLELAKFKVRYAREYDNGYLAKVKKSRIKNDWGSYRLGDIINVSSTQDYLAVDFAGIKSSIKYTWLAPNQMYIAVDPSLVGLLALSAFVHDEFDDVEPFRLVIAHILEQTLGLKSGEVNVVGYDKILKRCYNTLTVRDERVTNRHILLAGPPGCGKSMLVKKLIEMTPDWIHISLGNKETIEKFLPLLDKIATFLGRKIMVAMDEIDELGYSRNAPNANYVYQLLRVLDGIEDTQEMKLVATTNRPEVLDLALLRVGRLGPVMYIGIPEFEQRVEIINYYANRYDADINAQTLADVAISGSDIRAAFENCIIYGEEMTTINVLNLMYELKQGKDASETSYA